MKNKPMLTLLFAITTLSTTLAAGLFYSYSCSVNPGLSRLTDTEYLRAMQSINRAILNPVFFLTFMGTLVLLPLSAWFSYREGLTAVCWYFLAAAVIYLLAVFGVTLAGNVPLNEALDKFDIARASQQQIAEQRAAFEKRWNGYHAVRTIAIILSAGLAILGCLKKGG